MDSSLSLTVKKGNYQCYNIVYQNYLELLLPQNHHNYMYYGRATFR